MGDGALSVRATAALHGLPLCDPEELHDTAGLTWVRPVLVAPLLFLGILGGGGLLLVGELLGGTALLTISTLTATSLIRDTRMSAGARLLLAGKFGRAQRELERVADVGRHPARVHGCLAAIAWARGDHYAALRWTRTRGEDLDDARAPADARFLNRASEVLLLALLGQAEDAAQALKTWETPPPGKRFAEADAAAKLATAFALDEPEPVREHLERWDRLRGPDTPLLTAWLSWAWARLQDPARAQRLLDEVTADVPTLRLQAPRLADWVVRFDPTSADYRRA